MRLSRLMMAAGSTAALLFIAGPVFAQHAGKHDPQSKAKDADESTTPGTAGQGAAVDGQGKLRPLTSEEALALSEGIKRWLDQSTDGLTQTFYANGAVSVFLDDRFQSATLARLGKDGSVAAQCVTNMGEARQFLGQQARLTAKPAAATVALEEK